NIQEQGPHDAKKWLHIRGYKIILSVEDEK
ncbi:MAG: hypothetical protein RJA92_724, partial [Bacteroidota bacterium]